MHCREVFATELLCSLCQKALEVLGGWWVGPQGSVACSHNSEQWREASETCLPSSALSQTEHVQVQFQSEPSLGASWCSELGPGLECWDLGRPHKVGGVSRLILVFPREVGSAPRGDGPCLRSHSQ